MEDVKTIIFDLGGVIIDLDVHKTIEQFSAMSGRSAHEIMELYTAHPSFMAFEKGIIDAPTFRRDVRTLFADDTITDHAIDRAWNAMLIALPQQKVDLMRRLRGTYRVMILSNTNSIHIDYVYAHMLPPVCDGGSFEALADKVYYSHLLGLRKPEPAIYEHVLKENGLSPHETVFLDDNADNIRAAGALGIVTRHITHPDNVYEIFN